MPYAACRYRHLRNQGNAELLDRLRAGSLDAAILSLPLDGEDLRWETLLEEPILVALPRDHSLAAERRGSIWS